MKTSMCFCSVICLGLILPGCNKGPGNKTSPNGGASGNGTGTAANWDGQLTLEVTSWEQIQKRIAAHKGKVVVVDFWANWCDPCKREFPNLVELQKRFGKKVAAISVNLSYDGTQGSSPKDFLPEVQKFLEMTDARFENFVASEPDEEVYRIAKFDAVPTIFVYSKTGELANKIDVDSIGQGVEEVSYKEHVVPLVEKLLAE